MDASGILAGDASEHVVEPGRVVHHEFFAFHTRKIERRNLLEQLPGFPGVERHHGFDGAQTQRQGVEFLLVDAIPVSGGTVQAQGQPAALVRLLGPGGALERLFEQLDFARFLDLVRACEADHRVGREFRRRGAGGIDERIDIGGRCRGSAQKGQKNQGNGFHWFRYATYFSRPQVARGGS